MFANSTDLSPRRLKEVAIHFNARVLGIFIMSNVDVMFRYPNTAQLTARETNARLFYREKVIKMSGFDGDRQEEIQKHLCAPTCFSQLTQRACR